MNSFLNFAPLFSAIIISIILAFGYITLLFLHPVQYLDRSSASNINEVKIDWIHIDLTIDFENRKIHGSITENFTALSAYTDSIHLDILNITVKSIRNINTNEELGFRIDNYEWMQNEKNQVLTIKLKRFLKKNELISIKIEYETSPSCRGLYWLEGNQTTSNYPFLYTVAETHNVRCVFPIQDTPVVKFPYSAKLRVKDPMIALATAYIQQTPDNLNFTIKGEYKEYSFIQPHPLPAYLITICSGVLNKKQVDKRVIIYAEPTVLEKASEVLSDLGKFLEIIESELIPYPWEYFGVVVMPFGYAVGGQENPLITFLSPTLLASGKETEDVAAHELVHSYFGNTVTCKNWSHSWINEGLTVYGERLIDEKFFGKDFYDASASIGMNVLADRVKWNGGSDRSKLMCLSNRTSVDDCFSLLQYEKGFALATNLEKLTGKHNFLRFLRVFLNQYKFKSAGAEEFREIFDEFVITQLPNATEILSRINWTKIFRDPGMPDPPLNFSNPRIDDAKLLAHEYLKANGSSPVNYERFHTYFSLLKNLFMLELTKLNAPIQVLRKIDADLNITLNEHSPEILLYWLQLNVPKRLNEIKNKVDFFLGNFGRAKYILPIYRATANADMQYAREIFKKYGKKYDFYSQILISQILKLEN